MARSVLKVLAIACIAICVSPQHTDGADFEHHHNRNYNRQDNLPPLPPPHSSSSSSSSLNDLTTLSEPFRPHNGGGQRSGPNDHEIGRDDTLPPYHHQWQIPLSPSLYSPSGTSLPPPPLPPPSSSTSSQLPSSSSSSSSSLPSSSLSSSFSSSTTPLPVVLIPSASITTTSSPDQEATSPTTLSTPPLLTSSSFLQTFVHNNNVITPKYSCDRPLDIIFCVDGSGSVNITNFVRIKSFIRDVTSFFDISLDGGLYGVQVGVVQFSDNARVEIALDAYRNLTQLQEAILNIDYLTGGTNTAQGITKSQADIVTYGRSATVGAAHLIIVITDGQSKDTAATIAAANAARDPGKSTVACITIGPAGAFSKGEIEGIVGNDPRLIFPIESWTGISDDGTIVANITSLACNTPIRVDDLTDISSSIACNASLFVIYFPNVTSPVTLVANISSGSIIVCFSYTVPEPSPFDTSGASLCSIVGLGETHIGTTTAYPNISIAAPQQTLYVSVSSTDAEKEISVNDTCGGNFTLSAFYCSTVLAVNITRIKGNGNAVWNDTSLLSVNTTIIGDPYAPRCSECPRGTAFLSTDPLSPLFGICSALCIGSLQYGDVDPQSGLVTCRDCDTSCSSCVAPGTARSCTTCPAGYALLPNAIDPAFTSPFWNSFSTGVVASGTCLDPVLARLVPRPADLIVDNGITITAGRCVPLCPPGYNTTSINVTIGINSNNNNIDDNNPEGGSALSIQTLQCIGSANDFINSLAQPIVGSISAASTTTTTAAALNKESEVLGSLAPQSLLLSSSISSQQFLPTVMSSICLSSPAYPPPPLASGTSCTQLAGTSTIARYAGAFAAGLGVPPAAIFLRSCVDFTVMVNDPLQPVAAAPSARWVWSYSSSSSAAQAVNLSTVDANELQTFQASAACNCSVVYTFAYLPVVAAPGTLVSSYSRSFALTTFSTDKMVLASRANTAQSTTLPISTRNGNTASASNFGPGFMIVSNCSITQSLYSYVAPILMQVCIDMTTPPGFIQPPSPSSISIGQIDAFTGCLRVLPPPSNNIIPTTVPVGPNVAAVVVPLLLLLACCLGSCTFYCRWRNKRLGLVRFHQAAIQIKKEQQQLQGANTNISASRGAIMSYVPEVINPHAAGLNPFDPTNRTSSKLPSNARIRNAFEPIRSNSMKLGKGARVAKEVEEAEAGGERQEQPEQQDVEEVEGIQVEMVSQEDSESTTPTSSSSSQLQVIMNPLASLNAPPPISEAEEQNPPSSELPNTISVVTSTTTPVDEYPPPPPTTISIVEAIPDSIADYGDTTSSSSSSSSFGSARKPVMSMSLKVLEFLAPSTVSLNMSLTNDNPNTLVEPIVVVSPSALRANRVRNAMRPSTQPPPTDTGPTTFNVDVVRTKREIVQTQTVRLRRVDDIKGDSEWAASKRNLTDASAAAGKGVGGGGGGSLNGSVNDSGDGSSSSPWTFTAVVKKETVVEEKRNVAVTMKRF